jgi:hypothetical protein
VSAGHRAGWRRLLWPPGWRRRLALWGGLSLIVLAAAYAVAWKVAADALEERVREALGPPRKNSGLVGRHGAITRSGFPAAIVLEIAHPTYRYTWERADGSRALLTWHDDRMTVAANPLRPDVLEFEWPKLAEIEAVAPDGSRLAPVAFIAGRARAALWLTGEHVLPLEAELAEVAALRAGDAGPIAVLASLRLDGRYGDGVQKPAARWRFEAVDLRGAELSQALFGPAGAGTLDHIDRVSGEFTVHGPLPNLSSNADMAAWRDRGGRLDLAKGRLDAPSVKATWQGRLALDPAMRLTGTIDATIGGLAKLLVDSGEGDSASPSVLDSLIVVLLGLLSDQDDPEAALPVSFEARDGRLYAGSALGAIPIGRLGPIEFEAEDGPRIPVKIQFGE